MTKTLLFCLILILTSCKFEPETIEVNLSKLSGEVKKYGVIVSFTQKDTVGINKIYPIMKGVPANWSSCKIYYGCLDMPQAVYQSYKSGLIDETECMKAFNKWKLDTANFNATPINLYVSGVVGLNEKKEKMILFDSNNNQDFSDDKPTPIIQNKPTPITIERFVDGFAVTDTTYVYTRMLNNKLRLAFSEYTSGDFCIGKKKYHCEIHPLGADYRSAWSNIIFQSDTTTLKGKINDYIKFEKKYFKIEKVTENGKKLLLKEVKDAPKKESFQTGFRPFSFNATSLKGDSISFPNDFKGKYALLCFWEKSCGSCRYEIETLYPGLYNYYNKAGFEIISVAANNLSEIKTYNEKVNMPWPIITEEGGSKSILKKYNITSYPMLALINPQGYIEKMNGDIRGETLLNTMAECYPELPRFKNVSADWLKEVLDTKQDIQIVDVRTEREYRHSHIKGSINIDIKNKAFALLAKEKLNTTKPILVYCKGGIRSRNAAWILIENGFTVFNLRNGYDGWMDFVHKK